MRIIFTKKSDKDFAKLDKSVRVQVLKKIEQIEALENPRSQGDGLTGNLAGLWRYRVGDYRIICKIKDDIVEILVIKIAHRAEVY